MTDLYPSFAVGIPTFVTVFWLLLAKTRECRLVKKIFSFFFALYSALIVGAIVFYLIRSV